MDIKYSIDNIFIFIYNKEERSNIINTVTNLLDTFINDNNFIIYNIKDNSISDVFRKIYFEFEKSDILVNNTENNTFNTIYSSIEDIPTIIYYYIKDNFNNIRISKEDIEDINNFIDNLSNKGITITKNNNLNFNIYDSLYTRF